MPNVRLSVLVVARNEEAALEACLKSASFADEIVVVLDRTTDRSALIAQAQGAVVFEGAWENEGERRNFAIAQCRGDWILELDADERISLELRDELRGFLPAAPPGHCRIPFRNYFCGQWVRWGWGAYNGISGKCCLFSRGMKTWGDGEVHPPITLLGHKGKLSGHIDHFIDETLDEMMTRLNWYASGTAQKLLFSGASPSPAGSVRRLFTRFFKAYVLRKGYREGWRGLALASFAGLYPFLTYLKLQELKSRQE